MQYTLTWICPRDLWPRLHADLPAWPFDHGTTRICPARPIARMTPGWPSGQPMQYTSCESGPRDPLTVTPATPRSDLHLPPFDPRWGIYSRPWPLANHSTRGSPAVYYSSTPSTGSTVCYSPTPSAGVSSPTATPSTGSSVCYSLHLLLVALYAAIYAFCW